MSRMTVAALLVSSLGCASGAGSGSPAPAPAPATSSSAATSAASAGTAGPASAAPGPATASAAPSTAALAVTPATAAPGRAKDPDGPTGSFRPPFQMNELSEKDWLRGVRDKLAERLKVPAADIFFSPTKQSAAVLRRLDVPSTRRRGPPPPRRYRIEVADHQGKVKHRFRPVSARGSDEPPKDLRFLAEDRLVYEVVSPPPAPPAVPRASRPGASRREKARASARRARAEREGARKAAEAKVALAAAGPPPRLFIIQPLGRRTRPIRCQGTGFDFARTPMEERMAFVAGRPGAAFVSVNGVQVYPRRGRAAIASEPTWSKDGVALAFLETPAGAPARLVLLAEFDNPNGDNTWPLPASARLDGARVFWAGPGKLVVGRTALKPLFATSFVRERAREFSP
jgi:hypothetical protein